MKEIKDIQPELVPHVVSIASMLQTYYDVAEPDLVRISRNAKSNSIFLDNRGGEVTSSSPNRIFQLVPTGYFKNNHEIYLSLLKLPQKTSLFVGTAVLLLKRIYGNSDYFTYAEHKQFNNTCRKLGVQEMPPKEKPASAVSTSTVKLTPAKPKLHRMENILNAIIKLAILPTSLSTISNEDWVKGCLLIRIGRARKQLQKNPQGIGYSLSSDGDFLAVNTGLINKLLNPVLIVANASSTGIIEDIDILSSDNCGLYGLNEYAQGSLLEVTNFFGEYNPYDVQLNSSTLTTTGDYNIQHVLQHRAFRLPAECSTVPLDVLSSLLSSAVAKATKMASYNSNYISPIYYEKMDCIMYCVPLHLLKSINDIPDVYGIFKLNKGQWSIVTILTPKAAISDIRIFSPYQETLAYKWA